MTPGMPKIPTVEVNIVEDLVIDAIHRMAEPKQSTNDGYNNNNTIVDGRCCLDG
ncbi:GL14923 [Drosophila persimilis]|uniref:GL14923 n=1 Tax=Drosophila persimilis TaxID=7234 RepID=B4H057_DROPE|nr:GL14923 [Drosophila persimilis]